MQKYRQLDWTAEQVSKFWDYESQFPENYFSNQVGSNIVDYIIDSFPDKKTILDYGCGPGFLIQHLLKKNLFVAGLEFSKKSLELVNQKFSESKQFTGIFELNTIVEKNLKFEIITLVEVIEHLDDFFLKMVLNNIKKILNDDGVLFITTPNDEDLEKSMVFCPNCDHVFHRWQHLRSWSVDSLSEYLLGNGFILNNVFTTNFGIPLIKQQSITTPNFKTNFLKRFGNFIFRKLFFNYKNKITYPVYKVEPMLVSHKQPHLVAVVHLAKK
jgi:2-polyprenyl-3-methyl-5-hydroxy-6-metoxy-1,4-benzoquinol methylase